MYTTDVAQRTALSKPWQCRFRQDQAAYLIAESQRTGESGQTIIRRLIDEAIERRRRRDRRAADKEETP